MRLLTVGTAVVVAAGCGTPFVAGAPHNSALPSSSPPWVRPVGCTVGPPSADDLRITLYGPRPVDVQAACQFQVQRGWQLAHQLPAGRVARVCQYPPGAVTRATGYADVGIEVEDSGGRYYGQQLCGDLPGRLDTYAGLLGP
jgi:hypothetical protein